MVEIDKGDDHQSGGKDPVDGGRPLQTEGMEDEPKEEPGQSFHQRITGADRHGTAGTAAAKEEPAEDRDVLIPEDRLAAIWAARCGTDDGEPFGNAIDADIEKGTDDAAEDKREQIKIKRIIQPVASQLFAGGRKIYRKKD
jgi:hypothetical protein